MTGQNLIRVGVATSLLSLAIGLAAPPVLLLAPIGIAVWVVGLRRREAEWDRAATEILSGLTPPAEAGRTAGDANDQLLLVAVDAGVIDQTEADVHKRES